MTLYGFFLFSSLYFILLYFFSWGKSSYIKCYLLVKEKKKKKKQLQGQRWKCWQCHSLTMLCDSATSAWNKLFNTLSEKLKVAKHDSQELVTRKKKKKRFFYYYYFKHKQKTFRHFELKDFSLQHISRQSSTSFVKIHSTTYLWFVK